MTGSTPPRRAAARSLAIPAAAAAALALGACSSFGANQNTYTCPASMTVPDLQTMATTAPGPNGTTVQTAGRINSIDSGCDKDGDAGIVAHLSIEFTGLRTTPGVSHLDLPYFVAMADSAGNILGKQQFTVALDFARDTPVAKTTDHVNARLPLKNPQLGNVYTVIVGFQLDKSQLDFNRAHLE